MPRWCSPCGTPSLAPEEIELLYWKLEATEATPRTLRPLHLLCMDSAWYLFAQDVKGTSPEPRLYLLSRMRQVRRTGRTFERPQDLDLTQKLAHSIGVFGGEPERLHLRLRGPAARWSGERLIHQTQEFIVHDDGTAELTRTLPSTPSWSASSWAGVRRSRS